MKNAGDSLNNIGFCVAALIKYGVPGISANATAGVEIQSYITDNGGVNPL